MKANKRMKRQLIRLIIEREGYTKDEAKSPQHISYIAHEVSKQIHQHKGE